MNKRRTLMSLFLLTLMVGNAVAIPLIIPLIAGLGLVGGATIGYWLGIQKADETQKLLEEYEQRLTSNNIQNEVNIRYYLAELGARDENIYSLTLDTLQYSKNYAWTLAKTTYLAAINNGSTHTDALNQANVKVLNYYETMVKNLIALNNETIEMLNVTIREYKDTCNAIGKSYLQDMSFLAGDASYTITSYNGYTHTTTKTVTALGNNYVTEDLVLEDAYAGGGIGDAIVKLVKVNTTEWTVVYQDSKLQSVLDQITTEYNNVINNLAAYFDAVNSAGISVNDTDLVDPYMLASQLNTDLNTTGYYGYAAAELALLGLPLTGLNKTISITVDNETYEGFLFTDWNTTFEVNQTYDPTGHLVYFVTDDGLYKIDENFTITDIRDKQGNELTNTTIIKYVNHTGDATKLLEELAELRQLYDEYLAMQSTGGGGSGWWSSLDQTAKLGVIAIGAIAVYAIFRRR